MSYRDVEELLTERDVEVGHVTIYRWVQRFTPLLADAARFRRHSPGGRWFVDVTYFKVNGVWRCVYRAIDQYGKVIDVLVCVRRDAAAARRFLHPGAAHAERDPERGARRCCAGLSRRAGELPSTSEASAGFWSDSPMLHAPERPQSNGRYCGRAPKLTNVEVIEIWLIPKLSGTVPELAEEAMVGRDGGT